MAFDDIPPNLIASLEAAQDVAFRMALTSTKEQWHIHTLMINVLPQVSRGSWPTYDYNYGHVAFIAGSIPGSVASKWLLSEKETVNAYTFQMPLQVDFERPLWHPSNISNDLPSLPWPHTRYNATLSYEPREDPFAPYIRRPRDWPEQIEPKPRSWPREARPNFLISKGCPFYSDFTTAVFHLMYGQADPEEELRRKLKEAIIIRIAHSGAWLGRIHLTPLQVSVDVKGNNLSNSRLQAYGTPDLQYDQILLHEDRLLYPLPHGIPEQLWFVLSRDNECLDFCLINAKWSPFASKQKNVVIEPPDLQTQIQELIAQGEGPTIEFKRHISDDGGTAIKTVAAFANGEGGVILLGVDDKSNEIVGIAESLSQTKRSVADLIRRKVVPEPHFRFEQADFGGKTVVAIYVEKGNSAPYGINPEKPEFYVRRGASTFPAKHEEIVALAQPKLPRIGYPS